MKRRRYEPAHRAHIDDASARFAQKGRERLDHRHDRDHIDLELVAHDIEVDRLDWT